MKRYLAVYCLACVAASIGALSPPAFAGENPPISNAQAKEAYEQAKDLIHTYSGDGDNYEAATALAERIHQALPESPYSYLIVAELMARKYKDRGTGDPKQIWALTERASSIDPRIAGAYVIRSKMALLAGDIQKAKSEADFAIALDRQNEEAMFAEAQIEEKYRNYSDAENWYRQAIAIHKNPDRKSNIYYWLAKMYQKMSPPELEKAANAMAQCVELSPNAPWKNADYAIFLNTKMGDYEKAATHARRALAVKDFHVAHLQLGMALYGQWARELLKSTSFTPTMIAAAQSDVEAIVAESGILPEEAREYAFKYMSNSRIPIALNVARVLDPPAGPPPAVERSHDSQSTREQPEL